ncbi:MAG: NAD(P)H-hydrate dehydratase [Acidimicrobiia bacterium]
MEPILSVAEMRRVDAETTADIDRLMEAAGNGIALSAARMGIGYGSRVHIVAGKGNNGGDGYLAARYLTRRGATVVVHHVGVPPDDTPAHRAMSAAISLGVRVKPIGSPEPGDLLIDAFVGTGFEGVLPDEVAAWTEIQYPVLAVDVPSGIDGDTGFAAGAVFRAERTATFHMYKTGHFVGDGPDLCGQVDLYDIGLEGGDPTMYLMTAADVEVPDRQRTTYKWSAGAVATIGGVPGLTGAALFAARGAIAGGAGASVLFTTAATSSEYASAAPDIPQMQASETTSWRNHASEVLSLLGRFDVLVMGPGLEPVASEFVEHILDGFKGTAVVDAGALNAISRLDVLARRSAPTVLTPHGGEFKRLTGLDPDPLASQWLADETGAVVVMKGNPTLVVSDTTVISNAGGPELATIGTGDVLAGLIAAFIAGGVDAPIAAASAAYVHGVAGSNIASRGVVTPQLLIDEVSSLVAARRAV